MNIPSFFAAGAFNAKMYTVVSRFILLTCVSNDVDTLQGVGRAKFEHASRNSTMCNTYLHAEVAALCIIVLGICFNTFTYRSVTVSNRA